MKIKVTLSNSGGELDADEFDVPAEHPDPAECVNLCAGDIIGKWILSAGDTITIREV